jgi:hypothetical protein
MSTIAITALREIDAKNNFKGLMVMRQARDQLGRIAKRRKGRAPVCNPAPSSGPSMRWQWTHRLGMVWIRPPATASDAKTHSAKVINVQSAMPGIAFHHVYVRRLDIETSISSSRIPGISSARQKTPTM